MKIALCVIAGVVVIGVMYSLAPDLARYIKIKSM
jgi:hypothetical protein